MGLPRALPEWVPSPVSSRLSRVDRPRVASTVSSMRRRLHIDLNRSGGVLRSRIAVRANSASGWDTMLTFSAPASAAVAARPARLAEMDSLELSLRALTSLEKCLFNGAKDSDGDLRIPRVDQWSRQTSAEARVVTGLLHDSVHPVFRIAD